MEMVFVYEDKIAQDSEGNFYTGSAFSQEVFDRYLLLFDHITLLMRKAKIDPYDLDAFRRLNRIDTSNIDLVFLPDPTENLKNFLSPKLRSDFKRIVLENISKNRAVIMRAPSGSGTIAAEYCHEQEIPFLVEAVGCPWDSSWYHSIKGKLLALSGWKAMRRVLRYADYAVYVTSEFLQRRYPTNGKSIAISDVELKPMDEKVLEKRLHRIENHTGKMKLTTAAAVNAGYKGQKFVIEALADLKKQGNTSFEYHLVGGGDPSALQELAKRLGVNDQVFFEGSLPHESMFAWFDSMDLYIQPSLQEGLPRAVVEAMSRGLPALGAHTGGIPELLGNDCIFPRKSVKDIVEKLSGLTKKRLETMAKNNFECAKQFQKELLEQKRYGFYSDFITEVKEKLR